MTQQAPTETLNIAQSVHSLWGLSLQPCGCPQCHTALLVPDHMAAAPCPLCSQGNLAAQPVLSRQEPPERYLPVEISTAEVSRIIDKYIQEVWLRPDDFNLSQLLQRIKLVFWPMWLVDCDVSGSWEAEMGYDYRVQSSKETLQNGTWKTQALVETRANWQKRCGTLTRHYENVFSSALEDHTRIINLVGEYNHAKSQPYHADDLADCSIVIPDIHPENAWPMAESNLRKAGASDCAQAAGAQHHRGFTWNTSFDRLNWTQLLMPLLTTYYTDDDGQRHTLLINGQTGKIGGVRMASQKKGRRKAAWAAGGGLLLFLFGLLFILLSPLAPPVTVLGILLILGGFAAVIYALVLSIWPLQWNNRQKIANPD